MKQILTAIIFMISLSVFSQERTITGVVLDETNQPLSGATLIVKGTRTGAMTDFDGGFSILAKTGDILSVSYLGAEDKEVTVGDTDVILITLKSSDEQLDEVVVIGYGTVKKSDLTGSVSSIKAEELTKTGTVALDQALAGRASGVVVTQNSGTPGAGASISIRGISTISDSQPLYVIDGIPMENDSQDDLNGETQNSATLSPLSLINPADIESIEILKDASATAIYGSRGANGVVLVTTKSGQEGKGIIQIDHEYSLGSLPNTIEVFDANQYWINRNEAQINGGETPIRQTLLDSANAGIIPTQKWLDVLIRTATTSNTNLKFSGGNKDLRYLLSTNILNQEGLVEDTDLSRIQTRLNLNGNVNKFLSIGTGMNYSVVKSSTQNTNTNNSTVNGASSVIRKALLANPSEILLPQEDVDSDEDGNIQVTPLTYVNNTISQSNLYQFLGNIYADIKFTKNLNFRSTVTYQNRATKQRFYQNDLGRYDIELTNSRRGWAKTGDALNTSFTNTNQLNYDKSFGKHNLNFILGQSQEWREAESLRTSNWDYANDLLTWYAPETAANYDPDQVGYSDSKLESYFGRVNLNLFKNKFLFTFTGRYDGSSKFAENNKWAFFPAGAIAYKLSNERFIKKVDAISNLKLRLSYGRVGNQALREYQSLAQLAPDQYVFGSGGAESTSAVYYANQIPNPNLRWETTDQFDAGIDLGLFKNRISLTADYYKKNTKDLLINNNPAPAQSGIGFFTQNFGEIESEGFEMALGLRIISKPTISWDVNTNFSVGKAIVKDLISDEIQSGIAFGRVSTGTQRLMIGEEVGTFFGWKTAGVSQFDDFVEFDGLSHQEQIDLYNQDRIATYTYKADYEGGVPVDGSVHRPGQQLYEDLDGDGVISEADKKIIGNAQPDIMFGINNAFSFGNIDFSFFFDGQLGQEVANVMNWNLLNYSGGQQLEIVKDAWTPENQSTTMPKVGGNGWGNTLPFSDRYVENASFVRLQNVTLGYSLPSDVVEKLKINGFRIFVSGTNLFTITEYTGFNPDVNLGGRNALTLGHDNAGYPVPSTVRLGVSLKI
ncbi:TonB-dependent receptor [Tamlana sp. 1_MG-2023]|uniref:SusC/RagA family TonB-linked outer membrane protein n=1 Tax=Tamlana sp. 1_MG-2023 TaxID=3062628 RepID=UPI0026E243FA|nr:TonB-dependent receptor [Tamlana sp. 1_MG-2023]MDO6792595.1 TonB-dependent receptor [Tamlana sp. 1_MG-2023]